MSIKNKCKNVLSQIRIYRVRMGVLLALLCLYFAKPSYYSFITGIPIIIIGAIIRVWASGHILKSSSLTVSGPYSYFRHPLYVGSLIVAIGFAIISQSLTVIICLVVYFGLFYPITIIKEETLLHEKFKDSFNIYKNAVSTFFSKKFDWYLPGRYSQFNPSLFLLNREYRLIITIVIVLILLYLKMKYLW
jgi:protein-S-isoprenylcysteine O-methyltransferase Ste14